MDGTPGLNDTPPPWLVRLCHELWARLHGLWSIGVSLFGNLLAALLFIPISPFSQFTQFWAYQYKIAIIISLLVLLCFSLGIGFVSRFETTPSLYARRHHYLRQVILDHRSLKASGIPEIFFPPSIKLEEVFIPLQLINERTPVDYPLRAEEIPVWQRIFARRKKRPPRELLMERSGPGQNVEIAEFWQHCNRENPVIVVQGYPGMGKSTLMKRLALHMARRCLKLPDPRLPALSPALVPLFIELRKYKDALLHAQKTARSYQSSPIFRNCSKSATGKAKIPGHS